MNTDRANEIIDNYIAQFPETTGPDKDELFKWKAAAIWKNAWDINAPDFADMLKKAVSGTEMLINSKRKFPAAGIVKLCTVNKETAESVRKEFIALLQDVPDISEEQKLMDGFIEHINTLIHDVLHSSWIYEQDRKSVSGYMGLARPERDYLYKSMQVKAFADYVEFDDNIGSGQTFSLKNFYRLCDELTAVIADRQDLMDTVSIGLQDYARANGIDSIAAIDPLYHILVFDIIYCTEHYGFYTTHPHVNVKRTTHSKSGLKQCPPIKPRDNTKMYERQQKRLKDRIDVLKADRDKLQYPDVTGMKLNHKAFGMGKVIKQDAAKVQIKFSDNIIKKMDLKCLYRGKIVSNFDADVLEAIKKISDIEYEIDKTTEKYRDLEFKIFSEML